jgi:Ca2+-transporting ATPase
LCLLTLALQLSVVYVPFLQEFFRTQALSFSELLQCAALASTVFVAMEAEKLWTRRRFMAAQA